MNTKWKTAILNEIRNDPGITSKGLIDKLVGDSMSEWFWDYTPQDIYRDLYTLEKQGEITRTDDKPKRCYIALPAPSHDDIKFMDDKIGEGFTGGRKTAQAGLYTQITGRVLRPGHASKPDEVWVVADDVCDADYLTPGKSYIFSKDTEKSGDIIDDKGNERYIYLPWCAHLSGKPWRIIPKPTNTSEHEPTITIQYDQHEHQLKLISELMTWKANAIAKHPDLDDDPILIKARELFSEIMNDCVETDCTMRGENDKNPAMVKLIEALGGT